MNAEPLPPRDDVWIAFGKWFESAQNHVSLSVERTPIRPGPVPIMPVGGRCQMRWTDGMGWEELKVHIEQWIDLMDESTPDPS